MDAECVANINRAWQRPLRSRKRMAHGNYEEKIQLLLINNLIDRREFASRVRAAIVGCSGSCESSIKIAVRVSSVADSSVLSVPIIAKKY